MREEMPPATEGALLGPALGTMQLSFEPPSRQLEQVGIAALSDAAKALDISLLDHIIVGSDRYCSLRADGRVAF